MISCPVKNVAITPDGRTAVSVSDDNSLRVWDLNTGSTLQFCIQIYLSTYAILLLTEEIS